MRLLQSVDEMPPTERNIIVSSVMTMRDLMVDIMRETNCDLLDRIEKMDTIIKTFHDNEYTILIERYKE